MISNCKHSLLFLMILTSFSSCVSNPTVRDYFNRPDFQECLTAFESGYAFCDGIKTKIPPRLPILIDFDDVNSAREYYDDKEFRLYVCLRFPRKCK